jgi:hypothetical protein
MICFVIAYNHRLYEPGTGKPRDATIQDTTASARCKKRGWGDVFWAFLLVDKPDKGTVISS